MMKRILGALVLILAIGAGPAFAQAPAAPAPTPTETPAATPPAVAATPEVAAAPDTTAPPPPAPVVVRRSSWTSDATPLRVGDVVTVLIDEETSARERVTNVGQDKRTLSADLKADANGKAAIKATGIESGWNTNSRNSGEANRQGNLTGTLSVRVLRVEPGGLAEIEGRKAVSVDGREQTMTLHGFVRPEDVSPGNVICSVRIADATIKYQGKKMGAKIGILGKLLSIIWP
jgi:flagellar L-ring protein precursor FlgH